MGPASAKGAHVVLGAAKASGCLAKLGPFGHALGGVVHFAEWLEKFIFLNIFRCFGVLVLIIIVLSATIFFLLHH